MLSTVTPIPTINSDGTLPNIEGYLLLLAARTGGRLTLKIVIDTNAQPDSWVFAQLFDVAQMRTV